MLARILKVVLYLYYNESSFKYLFETVDYRVQWFTQIINLC